MSKKKLSIRILYVIISILLLITCCSTVFAEDTTLPTDDSLSFTLDEKRFIKDSPQIRVTVDANWAPMEYLDQTTQTHRGINIDILNELSTLSGLKFHLIPASNYQQCAELFETSQADLMFGYTASNQNSEMISSLPFLEIPTMFIGRNNMNARQKSSVAMPNLTSKMSIEVMRRFPQFEYIDYGSRANVLDSLRYQKEDFVFINSYDFNEIERRESIANYTTIFTDITYPLNIYVSPNTDPIILGILNKSIQKLTPQQIDSIVFTNTVHRTYEIPFSRVLKENAPLIISLVVTLFAFFALILFATHIHTKFKLENLAYVDSLTQVSTLAKFYIDAIQVLKHANPSEYMLVHLDLNNFKYINNSFGYDVGDKVLIAITEHFIENKGKNEILARIGADNFIFLSKSLSGNDLLERFQIICNVNEHISDILPKRYHLVFSVGTYVITDTSMEISSMLDKANIARKSVKGSHFNSITEYTQEMDRQVEWEKEVTLSMQNALDNHEFEVYLQPKYRLEDEHIISTEALVRWSHPKKGVLAPGMFISLFEQNGFIQKVDFYMFEQVCILIQKWQQLNPDCDTISISVNLSRLHLNNPHLVEDLIAFTQKYEVSPEYIEIELTESLVFLNSELLIRIMHQLKEAGFQISIDDFGSGYSSLNLLKDLPVDIIKIDKAFLEEAADTNRGQRIIASIIEMTKKLNLVTVAEGVETREQMVLLYHMGCDIAQGYYYAKPMPVSEFETRYISKEALTYS
ncbi:MAG: EAL domain-containing protein [Oscillospiraceae bacterium]